MLPFIARKPPRRLACTVTKAWSGKKVGLLLRDFLGLSGTVVRRIKAVEDGILLDGRRVFTNAVVREGQLLSAVVGDTVRRSEIPSVPGPLDIWYEDEDLLVLNKAPFVSVHPGPGHWNDTLGNFLLAYYDRTGDGSDFHPVHRLDRGTSGLLVVAKHAYAQERLKNQLHTPHFRRIYLALCQGQPSPAAGAIDAPIGRVDGSLLAREVRPDGQRARTTYQTLAAYEGGAFLRLELETGRTHQIRVHLAHLGCPLTGDFLYGTEEPRLISRPALHSAELSFLHPVSGLPLTFSAPLPGDMAALLPSP